MSHTYRALIFENTGFNAVNIPLNKSVVRASANNEHICTGLTLTQQKWLSSIRVPLKWADVNNADYLMIHAETEGTTANDSFCYFITGVIMQAEDVAELMLIPDFLTSAGGVDSIEIIDGITTRSTYALNHIEPNKLNSGDGYLAPSETMELLTEWVSDGTEETAPEILIESTINIIATAQKDEACTAVSDLYDVTYPIPEYADESRDVVFTLTNNNTVVKNAGAMLFKQGGTYSNYMKLGLAKIRGMGLESAILHSYAVPKKYAEITGEYNQEVDGIRQYYILSYNGKWGEHTTNINLHILDASDRINEVLNFSEYTKYGLMSASGERLQSDPKDLMTTANPKIRYVGDPRPTGRPYFRFEKLNNNDVSDFDFFRNCVSGLPWRQIQLVFTEASGNALNTAQYEASRTIADVSKGQAERTLELERQFNKENKGFARDAQTLALLSTGVGVAASGAGSFSGASSQGALLSVASGNANYDIGGGAMSTGAVVGATSGITSGLMGLIGTSYAESQATSAIAYQSLAVTENYYTAKMADALSYGIAQNVSIPTVAFPYNNDMIRDFYGNGFMVYRFWYTSADITRIKKIIKAYGVKYTMKTEKEHFAPEGDAEYAYCEAHGVTVGKLPQWHANGISAQLANGVRIWNTKPHHIS